MLRSLLIAPPAAALVCTLCLAHSGCGLPGGDYFGAVDDSPDPGHLRWCNAGEPEFIDPALVRSTVGIPLTYALFDGLTDLDEGGFPEPALATHWDISPDQRRFTFHLHDRGRWSDGRPITAHDFAYQLARVLHPLTFSRNAQELWMLKAGEGYFKGRVKILLQDSPPFRAGDVVEVLGLHDPVRAGAPEVAAGEAEPIRPGAEVPDSNLRTAAAPLALRDLGASAWDAYAIVPAGEPVTVISLQRAEPVPAGSPADVPAGLAEEWAYVHWAEGNGHYGWVPRDHLTGQPNGEVVYWVRAIAPEHRVAGVGGDDVPVGEAGSDSGAGLARGAVRGTNLLMLPEALGIRVPDPRTLVLETWGPMPFLIAMTPRPAFRATPRRVVSRWPLRWTDPGKIVTSGPFHLDAWQVRDHLGLSRSPTYWRGERIKLERITAFSLSNQSASTHYYMHGGCDATCGNNIPASYVPVLNGEKRGRPYKDYRSAAKLSSYFYLFNTEKVPSVHLRRALSLAIDRRPFPGLLHGGQIPTAQFVPGTRIRDLSDRDRALCGVTRDTRGVAMIVESDELCYVSAPGLDFDPDRARAELALARKELGESFPGTITLKFNTTRDDHKIVAEYIQRQWLEILGLEVALESQEWKTYLKALIAGEFEIARYGLAGNFPDPETQFLAMFKCNSPDNGTRWCNPEFDRLFQKAESTADRAERLRYLLEAEKIMVAEAPVIALYVDGQHHLQKPYVRGLTINPVDKPPLHRAWIDPDWKSAEGSSSEATAGER